MLMYTRKHPTSSTLLILALIALAGTVVGETLVRAEKAVPVDHPATAPTSTQSAYLGVVVEQVPLLLRQHLRDRLESGQGVVIVEVVPDSPAAQAGLRPGDILIRLDDEIVFENTQLAGLLAMHGAGETIELTAIQVGQRVPLTVTFGPGEEKTPAAETPAAESPDHAVEAPTPPPHAMRLFTTSTRSGTAFVSGHDDRYSLEVQYRDDQAQLQVVRWSGTGRQLKIKLKRTDDIPGDLRDALIGYLEGQRATPGAVPRAREPSGGLPPRRFQRVS